MGTLGPALSIFVMTMVAGTKNLSIQMIALMRFPGKGNIKLEHAACLKSSDVSVLLS